MMAKKLQKKLATVTYLSFALIQLNYKNNEFIESWLLKK